MLKIMEIMELGKLNKNKVLWRLLDLILLTNKSIYRGIFNMNDNYFPNVLSSDVVRQTRA